MRLSRAKRAAEYGVVVVMLVALAGVTWLMHSYSRGDVYVMGFWLFMVAVLLWGLLSHLGGAGRFLGNPVAPGRVLVLIPTYNEANDNVHATVRSVLDQTVHCDIIVVDDGSVEPVVPFPHPRVRWVRQANAGKRQAQITGLYATERGEYDYVMTVDGDSAPHADALEHLLRAMSDPEVWAATGWVNTRNYRDNWVARCADLDIGVAMVMNRSSRTQIGAIETMSGALALYRADLLWDEADDYLRDNVGAGDDRWLTARALLRGKAVGVNEAIVDTDMPTEVRRTFQQRVRWCKSTYLMAGYSIARYRFIQLLPSLINFIYIVSAPVAFITTLAVIIYNLRNNQQAFTVTWTGAAGFLVIAVLSRICLVALYLLRRPNMSAGQKWLSMAIGSVMLFPFSVFAVAVPKYWAILKLRQVRWTTREIKGHTVLVPKAVAAPPPPPSRRLRDDDAPPDDTLAIAIATRSGKPEIHRRRDLNATAVMSLVDLTARLAEEPGHPAAVEVTPEPPPPAQAVAACEVTPLDHHWAENSGPVPQLPPADPLRGLHGRYAGPSRVAPGVYTGQRGAQYVDRDRTS